jgi:hypothetical protein
MPEAFSAPAFILAAILTGLIGLVLFALFGEVDTAPAEGARKQHWERCGNCNGARFIGERKQHWERCGNCNGARFIGELCPWCGKL